MRDLAAVIPQVQTNKKTKRSYSLMRWNMILVACTLVFGATYLFEINSLSTKGYEIRQLERKIKEMETEQKHLEVQAANLQSINRIQQEAKKLNFVPTGSVTYIKDSDFALK